MGVVTLPGLFTPAWESKLTWVLGRVLLLREFRSLAAMAKTGNAEVPIETDADISNLGSESGGNRAEGPSPTKKRERPLGGEQDRPEGGGLTLADLQLALAPVLQGLQNLQGRMQTVEAQVSQKLDHTLNMVKTLHERQKEQENEIHRIAGSLKNQEQNQQSQAKEMKVIVARLEALEQKCAATAWKSKMTQRDNGGHTPALIIGGWPDDQPAEDTVQKAREYLQKLRVPLDLQGLFTPGLRRGYSILPIEPKEGSRTLCQRLVGVVSIARTVQEHTEARSGKGQPKQVWVATSEPPEQRRKSRFAGKVKRLVLEAAETLAKTAQVQAEYRAGTVRVEGKRVASATAPKLSTALDGGHGWIDVAQIAATMGTHESEVKARWLELEQQLN